MSNTCKLVDKAKAVTTSRYSFTSFLVATFLPSRNGGLLEKVTHPISRKLKRCVESVDPEMPPEHVNKLTFFDFKNKAGTTPP